MDELGYAVVGCGRVSARHMDAAETIEGARLVAVADSDPRKTEAAAQRRPSKPTTYHDYHDLLADPRVDVVAIAAPTQLHSEVAVAAAQAGKHIYCEKAMAASLHQCRTMADAASECGVKLTVGHSTRFQPPCAMARRLIDGGAIGEVFAVDARFSTDAEPPSRGATDSWRYRAGSAGNGHVINFGCHYIDTARFFAQQDPVSVSACIGNRFSEELISEDQFVITSRCDRQAVISIALYCSPSGTHARSDGYTIRGTDGIIEVPGPWSREILLTRDGGNGTEPVQLDADLRAENAFVRLHRLFREAIESDGEVPVSGEDAAKNLEWGLAAYLSNEQRRWLDLPLGPEYGDFAGPVRTETIPATR